MSKAFGERCKCLKSQSSHIRTGNERHSLGPLGTDWGRRPSNQCERNAFLEHQGWQHQPEDSSTSLVSAEGASGTEQGWDSVNVSAWLFSKHDEVGPRSF